MKTSLKMLTGIFISVLLFLALPLALAASSPEPATIILLNDPPACLSVGESYTLDIRVESEQPFTLALVQPDIQFPAYVHGNGGDRAQSATSAVLHLTLTGFRSTATLPGGATPVTAVVAVRFKGGQIVVERFPFNVAVPCD